MADNDHSLVFSELAREVNHPDQDRDGCDFQDYVDRDWNQGWFGQGRYLFTWHEGDPIEQPGGYWNGTYMGLTE